ncbi:4-carboxymuconolactone decarboxylase [Novosphingobium sp. SG751A]|uniref:carboxymuconolactone decarboxylase family protein n=1 Tax=Novosphingobium sp. SG751A TaxID=2587000 RepID=UPI001C12B4C1|nr:carboxymuconolactone decarboxylase family protein [Novosphingobium sp. SG751A]NOW48058.1 4-carboxymuconolactone decarboxylase [Novosphingobium sp. SG751A]
MTKMAPGSDTARIPLLSVEDMNDDQRSIYDDVVAGPRGRMIGPLRAAIHSPEMAALWSEFGAFLRYRTCLPHRLNELAIIVTGRRWRAAVEWWVHARVGVEAGLSPSAIEAIRDLRPPVFEDAAELEVYEFTRQLQQDGKPSEVVYRQIERRFGTRGVVELTAVIGYYTMVAQTLNAHEIPVPDAHMPLPDGDALAHLPAGRLAGA